MGEFAGYRCDSPNCDNMVNKNDPEARRWLLVAVQTSDEGYKESFTFCSYNCFHEKVMEAVSTQGAVVD